MEMLRDKLFAEYEDTSFDVRIKKILQTFQENKRVLKNIIGTELDIELADMIRHNFQQDMEREFNTRDITSGIFTGHTDILAVYYASGITYTILYWLSKSQPDSVDDLAKCFSLLLAPLIANPM